jgi:hypothetical protein
MFNILCGVALLMRFGILQSYLFLKTRSYSTRTRTERERFVLRDLGFPPPSPFPPLAWVSRSCLATLLFAPLNCSIGGEEFKQYLIFNANHYLVRQSKAEKKRQS